MLDILKTVLDPETANERLRLLEWPVSDGTVLVLLGSRSFWLQFFFSIGLQASVSAVFAVIVFTFIVKQRGSTMAYLVGLGFVIPAALAFPFYFINALGIVNTAVMAGGSAVAVIVPFACVEALYDTSPKGVEVSLGRYIGYYSSIIPFQRDDKGVPIPMTRKELFDKILEVAFNVFLIVLFLMVLVPCDFEPFSSPRGRDEFLPPSLWDMFHRGHLLNNLAVACFTCQSIETGSRGIGLGVSLLSGCKVINVMRNPMFASQSPSDFWGRRWNLMLHGSFKRGIFRPLAMHHVSRATAILITFAASGILHEYVCAIIGLKYRLFPSIADPFTPHFARQFMFFSWNGFVVLLEHKFSALHICQQIKKHAPKPLISVLVLLTVLPISHWFTDEYLRSGFYSDYSMGFPLILYLQTKS